jgi:TonB family protein
MVRSEKDFRNGWIISIIVHAVLAVMLMSFTVRQYIAEPQFVEMSWGVVSSVEAPIPNLPAPEQATASSRQDEKESENSVSLPKRKYLDLPDETISLRAKKKNISAENPVSSIRGGKVAANDRRTNVVSNGFGSRENAVGKSNSMSSVSVAAPFGKGTDRGGSGTNIAFAIQWAGGGNRKLVEGDMPVYPPGVNIQAQIKIKVTVLPDGTVRSAQPAQKGDTRLENAALAKVKFWQFEPLQSAQSQIEQQCDITFNFKLK